MRLDITLTEANILEGLLMDEKHRIEALRPRTHPQSIHLQSRLTCVTATLNNLRLERERL